MHQKTLDLAGRIGLCCRREEEGGPASGKSTHRHLGASQNLATSGRDEHFSVTGARGAWLDRAGRSWRWKGLGHVTREGRLDFILERVGA